MRIARVAAFAVLLPSLAYAQTVQPAQLIHRFTNSPAHPTGGLVETPDGSFYGTVDDAIYRLAPGGVVSIVARIREGHWGDPAVIRHDRPPDGSLVRGPDGALFGTTLYGGRGGVGVVFRFDPGTGEVRTIHHFEGANEGGSPAGGLTLVGGLLYSVTTTSIVRIDPATGAATVEYMFPALIGPDPNRLAAPSSPLTIGPDGLLYGTVRYGGLSDGALYRFDPAARTVTVLQQFADTATAVPVGRLVVGPDQRLYGASQGGISSGGGSVWRFDPATSTFTVVHAFVDGTGARPGPVAMAPDGSLYGTTHFRDSNADLPDLGHAIFRLRPVADAYVLETVRTFDPPTTGRGVRVSFTLGSDGLIYGYSQTGGPNGTGTIYRFQPGSDPLVFTVLHAFAPTTTWLPSVPTAGADNYLYGTTSRGGANGRGAIYRLYRNTDELIILGDVPGPPPGTDQVVLSALARDPAGVLYSNETALTTAAIERRVVRVGEVLGTVTIPLQTSSTVGVPLATLPETWVDSAPVRDPSGALFFRRFNQVVRYTEGPTLAVVGVPPNPGPFGETAMTPLLAASDGRIYVGVATSVEVGQFPVGFVTTIRLMRVDPASTALEEVVNLGQVAGVRGLVQAPDGRMFLGGHREIREVDPVGRTWRVACALPTTDLLTHLTALPDGRLAGVLEDSAIVPRQRLAYCTPSSGAVEVRELPAGIGRLIGPLVAAGGWLYATTYDAPPSRVFGGYPDLPQRGGALVRLPLDMRLPLTDTDNDGLPNTWETAYGLDPFGATAASGGSGDPDGDGRSNATELAEGTHPRGVLTRYFAEGGTGPFFRTRFDLANPTRAEAALVLLHFLTDTGTRVTHQVLIAPAGHLSIDAATVPGLGGTTFSTVVEADQAIGVDRTVEWDASAYGSHVETGITAPSTTWYFAEGSTSGPFALFYLLQNPHATPVTATIRYLRPGGQSPIERTYILPPASRTTIGVDGQGADLASTDVSAIVTATAPIVAERAMYFTQGGQPFAAGHSSAGVPAPALEWFLAEGATGSFFDLFVLLANPNASAATVEVEYLLVGGGSLTKTYAVPANGRSTIWVDDEQLPAGSGQRPLANAALSMRVRSTNAVPIVVERTMWWPEPSLTASFWYEAHNSPGATSTATRWLVSGGRTDVATGAQTFVLIANPSATPARVRLTALGRFYSEDIVLPPKSRTNVPFAAVFSSRFGVLVESLGVSPVPIVVEHATYASPGGVAWSSGGNALAAPLP